MGVMNEKRIEELGHLAFDKGFFVQWQDTASRYIQEERFKTKVDAYEQAYQKFTGTL
jgi:ABC-type Fe2+-enterobactin transport system substrate-binding protein